MTYGRDESRDLVKILKEIPDPRNARGGEVPVFPFAGDVYLCSSGRA